MVASVEAARGMYHERVFQGSEIFVILLVALVVLGPQRLPVVARKLGRWTSELRKAASDLRAGLESELGDVKGLADEVRSPIRELKQAADDTTRRARKATDAGPWVGPKPVSGPTPEDAMRDLEAIEEGRDPDDGDADKAAG